MKTSGMFPVLLVFFMWLSVIPGNSQELLTLTGRVSDSFTGKTLPFAQLSIRNSTLGTVSNEEGQFKLVVPQGHADDTLMVAYMGYYTLAYPLKTMTGADVMISMIPGPLLLAEVEIVAFSPEEVIHRVVANIPANYGPDSLILTAFVRSQKFVGGKLAEYTEAIIEDLKTGYSLYDRKQEKEKKARSNIPLLLKGRVISDTILVNAIGDPGKSAGCLGCNFVHDFVEFYHRTVLDEGQFKFYTFRMEELTMAEGGKIYHIWFDQKKGVKETLWKGELYINAMDFALLKITQKPSFEAYDQFEKQKYTRAFTINNIPGWFEEMPLMEWTTTYARRDGQYYLNTIRTHNWLTFENPSSGQKVKFAHKNEVVVTDATRDPEKIRNFKGDKSVGVNQRWDQVIATSDDHFWAEFNYLPVEEKLKKELLQISR
jgi:hypothetical protein